MSRVVGVPACEAAGASATEPTQVELPSRAHPLARVVVLRGLGMVPSPGDLRAFMRKVHSTIASVTAGMSVADREDMAQDLALNLWRAKIIKPQESSLIGWLRTAAVRKRARQRGRVSVVEFKEMPVEDDPDYKLDWAKVLTKLLEVAASLPATDRALLVLELLGYQGVEISRERGTAEGTVRGRSFRLREKLHRGLAIDVELQGLARTNIDAVQLCMTLLGEPDSPPPAMTSTTIRRLSQKAVAMFHESLRSRRRARQG